MQLFLEQIFNKFTGCCELPHLELKFLIIFRTLPSHHFHIPDCPEALLGIPDWLVEPARLFANGRGCYSKKVVFCIVGIN
jgi:hypothetical protein